jgi:hypothetical protein
MQISNFGELEHKTNISSPAPVGLGCSSDVFLVPSVHVASSPAAVLEKFLAMGGSSGDGPTSSTVELIILSSVDVGFSLGCSSSVGSVPSVHHKSPLFVEKLSSLATYLRFEGRSKLVGFVYGFDSFKATCLGSPTPAILGFSALTSDFSTSLADLGYFVSNSFEHASALLSFVRSVDGTRSHKFGATPSLVLDDKEFSGTEEFFSVSNFIVDGPDSFDAYSSGARLGSSCPVMSRCGVPIYPSDSKQVQRHYQKAKKGSVAQLDVSLLAKAVVAISVPKAQSWGVLSQPSIGVVVQPMLAPSGGGVSLDPLIPMETKPLQLSKMGDCLLAEEVSVVAALLVLDFDE